MIWLSFLAHHVLSWRRATGEHRQQLKWLASGAAVTFGVGVVGNSLFAGALGQVLGLAIVALPISIGVAILKYRLYDIDVVISKTIVYGSLAAFITAVYVLVVVGIGSLGPVPGTLARGRIWACRSWRPRWWRPPSSRSGGAQRLANRLVYGRRATPYEALSEFAGRVGGAYAADEVLPRMARVLAEGTGAQPGCVCG